MASPLLRPVKSKFITRGIAIQQVSDSPGIWDCSEHLGNGEKCFVFGEQQVKCLACIYFSFFSWAAVLKTAQNTNSLPDFMNSGCPDLWGCMCIYMSSYCGWIGRTPPGKIGVCFWAGTGLEGHWQRLVNAAAKKMWLTHQKKKLWCIWRSQLCFMNRGVGKSCWTE